MPRFSKKLIDAQVATFDSGWISTANLSNPCVHVYGITTADVEIEGSNEEGTPANGVQIGSTIQADAVVAITPVPNAIRLRITAWTSGTVSAIVGAELPG